LEKKYALPDTPPEGHQKKERKIFFPKPVGLDLAPAAWPIEICWNKRPAAVESAGKRGLPSVTEKLLEVNICCQKKM